MDCILKKYINKELKISKENIHTLESEFITRYNKNKSNNFECHEFANIFECFYDILQYFITQINEEEFSLLWQIKQVIYLIQNATQVTLCTNTKISSCPEPNIDLSDSKYYTDKLDPPCIDNVYETPYNGVRYPYAYCIRVIARVLHIIDNINIYLLSKEMTKTKKKEFWESSYSYIYFRNRYEYYLDYVLDNCPNIFIFPILQSIGATTLLNIRGSRIQICGIVFKKTFVDEDDQSPGNFFWHDINHVRRIYQNNIWYANNNKKTLDTLYNEMKSDIDKLLPLSKWIPDINMRSMVKMILFEVVHEDALPFTLDEIKRDILYEVGECYPYEKPENTREEPFSRKNIRFYEQGATTMATLYNKIRHAFFESETSDSQILNKEYRNMDFLAKATIVLLDKICELQGTVNTITINENKIKTLIASQKFSHHKDKELVDLEVDKAFEELKAQKGSSFNNRKYLKYKHKYLKFNLIL
jgi:hypothetical protein